MQKSYCKICNCYYFAYVAGVTGLLGVHMEGNIFEPCEAPQSKSLYGYYEDSPCFKDMW